VNFADSIVIVIPDKRFFNSDNHSPFPFAVANRCMKPIDVGVTLPFIGVNESII